MQITRNGELQMQIILKASENKVTVALKVHLDYQSISMSHKINTLKSYTVYSVSEEIKKCLLILFH